MKQKQLRYRWVIVAILPVAVVVYCWPVTIGDSDPSSPWHHAINRELRAIALHPTNPDVRDEALDRLQHHIRTVGGAALAENCVAMLARSSRWRVRKRTQLLLCFAPLSEAQSARLLASRHMGARIDAALRLAKTDRQSGLPAAITNGLPILEPHHAPVADFQTWERVRAAAPMLASHLQVPEREVSAWKAGAQYAYGKTYLAALAELGQYIPTNRLLLARGLLPGGKDALVLATDRFSGLPFWYGQQGWFLVFAYPPDPSAMDDDGGLPKMVYYAQRLDCDGVTDVVVQDVDGDGSKDLLYATATYGASGDGHHLLTIVYSPQFASERKLTSGIWPRSLPRLMQSSDGTLLWLDFRLYGAAWTDHANERAGVWAYRCDIHCLDRPSRRMATVYLPIGDGTQTLQP